MRTDERLKRWRLVLGGEAAEGCGVTLEGADATMDKALEALYGSGRGGEGRAAVHLLTKEGTIQIHRKM